jgi:uncharacterized protein (TIGR02646 family)
MRRLKKSLPEPAALADCRREHARVCREGSRPPQGGDWDIVLRAEQKAEIRQQLHRDQQGLCAYCMNAISEEGYNRSTPKGMKIEHFDARTDFPAQMFDWENLLGVCGGLHTWEGEAVKTCDDHRGSKALCINPYRSLEDPAGLFPINVTARRGDPAQSALGRIEPVSDPAAADCATLNLNAAVLCSHRADVIDALRTWMRQEVSDAELRRRYRSVSLGGPLPPYAPVAAAWLLRKLRARNLPVPP